MPRKKAPKPSSESRQREGIAALRDRWQKIIDQLDPAKGCPPREEIEWVHNNVLTPPEEIEVVNVPSRGAVATLILVQSSAERNWDFTKNIWTLIVPAKGQLEVDSRFNDDGRVQLALLDQFDEQVNNAASA